MSLPPLVLQAFEEVTTSPTGRSISNLRLDCPLPPPGVVRVMNGAIR